MNAMFKHANYFRLGRDTWLRQHCVTDRMGCGAMKQGVVCSKDESGYYYV